MNQIAQVPIRDTFFGNHAAGNEFQKPADLISTLLPNVLLIAGIIVFLYLVFGGFLIVTAAGNPDQAQDGQKAVTNAIIGLVVIFGSYWIIRIIEIITGLTIVG